MRYLLWPMLVLVVLVTSCGSPPIDLQTVRNLEEIRALPPDSVRACERAVAYEEGKKASEDNHYDEKSLKNVRDACTCMGEAIGRDSLVVNACRFNIDAFLVYENAKE